MPATKRRMDFTNVKEGGIFRPKHRAEGEYTAKVVKVDDHQPKDQDKEMGWVFTVTIDGDARSTYPVYAGPDEKQAWKIRKMFIAAGMNVPKKLVLVDPNKLVGKAIGVYLEDDEYEGRMRSRIADFIPVDDVTGEGDDEADEVEDDEVEEEAPPRKRAAAKKTARRRAPEPEEDEDEDDDEEVDEEPAPRRRAPAKKAAAKKTTRRRAPEPEDDDEDDVDDLDLEEL